MTEPPRRDTVDIWTVDPSAVPDQQISRLEALLSDDEKQRRDRYLLERLRHQYVVARAMARCALSAAGGVDPADWRFRLNEYGRPEIDWPETPLRFNLSHTTGLATCAITRGADVGIDAEYVARRVEWLRMGRRFFAPAEAEWLEEAPESIRKDLFFDFWTLKEAYIKARGMGLAIPLDRFFFTLDADDRPTVGFADGFEDDAARWAFRILRPSAEHRIAVALETRNSSFEIRLHDFTP